MSDNLFETLHAGFAGRMERPFLAAPDAAPLSYGEVVQRSAAFAGALRAVRVDVGDRVLVQVEKSADAIATWLACLRMGAVYVPLNVAYTQEELAYYLDDAAPRAMVGLPRREPELQALARRHDVAATFTLGQTGDGSLPSAAAATAPFDEVAPLGASDLAAMLYTSGTTGKPKGAMITHDNLATNARALFDTWGWRDDDVLLHALPVFHVHGLFVALHCAMLAGSRIEFLPRFTPGAVREALPRATVFMGVPTFYTRLLAESGFGREECAHMRLFISGSAPLPERVFRAFERRTGHAVLERYGMTETGILTSNPLVGDRVAGTVGYPLPGVELRVVDDDRRPLESGRTGSIEVRGPGLFRGYWRNPAKTKEELRDDGFFRTGDLGHRDAEGRVTLVGRSSDMIISGGYNVYPKEIELCLDEIHGVVESAVVGLPHPDFGEAVSAFVVRSDRATSETEIEGALADKLARFKHPKRVFFVDALPRNAMGKVQKTVLRREHVDAFSDEPED